MARSFCHAVRQNLDGTSTHNAAVARSHAVHQHAHDHAYDPARADLNSTTPLHAQADRDRASGRRVRPRNDNKEGDSGMSSFPVDVT